jgi:acyl-CoA-dependent ceramide synthase
MLNYLKLSTACDVAFGIFMVVWFFARHVYFLMVCWSIHSTVQHVIPYACFSSVTKERVLDESKLNSVGQNILQPFLDPEGPVCFNNKIRLAFLGTLLALQVITIMWYVLIVRIAWRVVKGGNADDERSDDDEEVEMIEELDEHQDQKQGRAEPLLEEDVGVESISFKNRGSPPWKLRKGQASASGVTLPGHSDRKELLGRIGCDKTT